MRRQSMLLMLSVLTMGLLLPAAPASATPPSAVHIAVPTTFGAPNFFTATGPAVAAGVMCPSGAVTDLLGKASGFQSERGVNFLVVKEFVCDDGSGSFTVKLQVRLDFRGDNFSWVILGGTGDYAGLHGSGSGVGVDAEENFVLDLYDGAVHID